MVELEGRMVVGILGQWASGKSTAANMLVKYLGGEDKVTFIADRELFAGQAVKHLLELDASEVRTTIEDDGRQRLEGEEATVWLRPEEDLRTVDLSTLFEFDVGEDVVPAWLGKARIELGRQIFTRSEDGKPIVFEAGFGEHPAGHTISDLFAALETVGVELNQVQWIAVEAGFDKRAERNRKRRDRVPVDVFARHAADGGDLDPGHRNSLEEQGTIIDRVGNDHDDIERFRVELIAAFEEGRGRS